VTGGSEGGALGDKNGCIIGWYVISGGEKKSTSSLRESCERDGEKGDEIKDKTKEGQRDRILLDEAGLGENRGFRRMSINSSKDRKTGALQTKEGERRKKKSTRR